MGYGIVNFEQINQSKLKVLKNKSSNKFMFKQFLAHPRIWSENSESLFKNQQLNQECLYHVI